MIEYDKLLKKIIKKLLKIQFNTKHNLEIFH